MKRIFFVLFYSVFSLLSLYAVKAYPGLITKVQADGSTISFYVHGDENFNYATSEDGYLLLEVDGIFEYATFDVSASIKSLGVKANNVMERTASENTFLHTQFKASDLMEDLKVKEYNAEKIKRAAPQKRLGASFPLKGDPKSLVILVNFADLKFTSSTAKEDYSRLLNETGYSENGATGSARDYFRASSNGVFEPNFVVVGPYNLPRDSKFYGEEKDGNHDYAPGQMIIDACNAADVDIDFTEFDTDKDGILDNVFVYYAGHNQAEGGGANTIWPHRSAIMSSISCDGVKLYDYACTSEFRGSSGTSMCGIGTFCHEFGHVLGLPDLYVTDYGSSHATPKSWDIMDNGSYNNKGRTPPTYSSYERFFLGWLEPIQITGGSYTLNPLVESNEAYLFATTDHNLLGKNPNPAEFFMIENRQKVGIDELGVPAAGMLVTHVYYNEGAWNANRPNNDPDKQGVQIYCASGTTSNPSANTYPGSRNVTSCFFTLRDGTECPIGLSNIREENRIIYFDYPKGEGFANIQVKQPLEDFDIEYGMEAKTQVVELIGSNITEDVRVFFKDARHFKLRDYSDTISNKFSTAIYCKPNSDSTFHVRVELKFDPKQCSYDEYFNDRLTISSGSYSNQYAIKGRARQPKKVVIPVAYEAMNVSPYAFTAHWTLDKAATEYYLSVYSIENVESSEMEDFSSFNSSIVGWTSNFKTVTKSNYKSSPQAVYFTTALDTIWSKKYFMPVSKLTFWLNTTNSVGTFFVDGKSGDQWVTIFEEAVTTTTRSKTFTIDGLDTLKMQEFKIYYETTSKNGGLAFDDFTAYFPEKINYVCEDLALTDTTFRVNGLVPNFGYSYKVKACEKDLEKDPPRYNYVTEYSNVIDVETVEGVAADEKELTIVRDANGYRVFVPSYEPNSSLYIYGIDGSLICEVTSGSDEFIVPQLADANVYILKYVENGTLKRKAKVAKLYYNL